MICLTSIWHRAFLPHLHIFMMQNTLCIGRLYTSMITILMDIQCSQVPSMQMQICYQQWTQHAQWMQQDVYDLYYKLYDMNIWSHLKETFDGIFRQSWREKKTKFSLQCITLECNVGFFLQSSQTASQWLRSAICAGMELINQLFLAMASIMQYPYHRMRSYSRETSQSKLYNSAVSMPENAVVFLVSEFFYTEQVDLIHIK